MFFFDWDTLNLDFCKTTGSWLQLFQGKKHWINPTGSAKVISQIKSSHPMMGFLKI